VAPNIVAMRHSLLLLASLAPVSLVAQGAGRSAADSVQYVVLMSERVAGSQTLWRVPDGGERRVVYEYNDRGRGPRLVTRVVAGPDGAPTTVETAGHGYFKDSVAERFSLAGGRARWESVGERGEQDAPVGGRAFYVSSSGPPEETAALARALRRAPGQRLALLPGGEARLQQAGELTVRSAAGESRTIRQFLITGLGFAPIPVWLDADGELFALRSGTWMAVIRAGWERALPAIAKAETDAEQTRAAALARSLVRRPASASRALVFRHASLFDPEAKVLRPNSTVVVQGERIVAAGADGAVRVPANAEVIDATGKTILPGLWDMHVHMQPGPEGIMHLAAGVTAVRDMANGFELLALRREIDAGRAVGPRIVVASGFIDGPGPYQGPTGLFVSTPDEARAAVARYADSGYQHIKVYSSLKPALVSPIVDEAHRRGMRVSGHVPAYMTAEQFVRAGADEIQHANMLVLNFLGDTLDTRTPTRFTAVARHAGDLDVASDSVRRFIALLRERNVVVDPTVNIFEGMFTGRLGEMGARWAPVAQRFPPQVRRSLPGGGLPVPEGMDARYRSAFASMLRLVKALHDGGVRIVPGTDDMPGFALHRELELYAQAGIPNADVLALATLGSARVANAADRLGTVAAGKLADFIVVEGDPLQRMSDVRNVRTVVKGGALYDAAALWEAVGVAP
jgi:imidazolonepropionase-like amidohydrolase